jgi:hypothetical protein
MSRELIRKLLQAHLKLRQPGQAVEPVRDAAGTPLTPTSVHGRSLESIFGTVVVARTGYRAAGTCSLHPLDGALNLSPEKYSLEVRCRVAMEAAKSSFDEGVKTLEVYTGAHLPKLQFEELVIRAGQDFEAFYANRQAGARAAPHAGSILVLTVDGKGVVMRPEDLREATQRAAAARAKTFTARLRGGRRLHAKRMASVAAIYTVEPFVRTPEEILPESPTLQATGLAHHGPNTNGSGPAWRSNYSRRAHRGLVSGCQQRSIPRISRGTLEQVKKASGESRDHAGARGGRLRQVRGAARAKWLAARGESEAAAVPGG